MGTHILPEAERVRILELVRTNREKVNALLDEMPFVIDSYGLRAKHAARRSCSTASCSGRTAPAARSDSFQLAPATRI